METSVRARIVPVENRTNTWRTSAAFRLSQLSRLNNNSMQHSLSQEAYSCSVSSEIHYLYPSPNIIWNVKNKNGEMGVACSPHGEKL
jgi:hypothetical protein